MGARQDVSRDTVYSEHYNELRRYRDYELTASTWYTVILLGALGFIISAKFGGDIPPKPLGIALTNYFPIQFFVALVSTMIGGASLYSIRFANLRYQELRNYMAQHLEPSWWTFTRVRRKPTPLDTIYFTQLVIIGVTNYLLFSPPDWKGILAAAIGVGLICLIVWGFLR